MEKSTISMVMFNSYVKLPEGIKHSGFKHLSCQEVETKLLASSPLATVYLGGIAYVWTLKSPKTESFSVVTSGLDGL